MSVAILPSERTTAFLVRRVRLGLGLLLFSVMAFAIADVFFAGAARRGVSWVAATEVTVLACAFLFLQGHPSRGVAAATALTVLSIFCVTTALSGGLMHDTTTTPLLLIVLTLVSATLLPWGFRRQVKLVIMALVGMAANFVLVPEVGPLSGYANVA